MSEPLYFPALTVREAECKALSRLAGPTKDRLFPIFRMQAWPRRRKDFATFLDRSIAEIASSFEDRSLALDLALPRTDLDSVMKVEGAAEIASLHQTANGHEQWTKFVSLTKYVPVFQWSNSVENSIKQWESLAKLGRGIVLRFRRSQGWNQAAFDALPTSIFSGLDILAVFDCDQISRTEDLTLLASTAQNVILSRAGRLDGCSLSSVLMGSSFPSGFAEIDPVYSKMAIRERSLFSLLAQSPPLRAAGVDLWYGDHASVFADSKEPAFRGAPRVDLPSKQTWAYHRRKDENGYQLAAQAVMNEPEWRDDLLNWGMQEIRRAASGEMTGLNAGAPWTAIRINNHLHQQAHFHEGPGPIEEDWAD